MVGAFTDLCRHLLSVCYHGGGSPGRTRHAPTVNAAERSHHTIGQEDAGNF